MTRFLLNGAPVTLQDLAPGRTVLDHLRLEQRLTATKEGCAEGDCGACTVVLGRKDGAGLAFTAVNACIMRAQDLDGCVVLTAEGLAQAGVLAPVQRAMMEFHGSQCGFCTPGFVMSLYALSQAPLPEETGDRREVILDALAGNLCRCTGYRPIVAAAESMKFLADPRVAEWRAALDALTAAAGDAPCSLDELDAILAANPAARMVSGATDLGVGIAKYGKVPEGLVSLRDVKALQEITMTDEALVVGAGATYSAILPHLERHFPGFAALVRRIGSLQIRNAGTMGANVCNASPIGDSAPCLIALGAVLRLRSAQGERELAVEDFFLGYRKTALRPGEYLRAISIPWLRRDETFFSYKLAKRFDQDISTVAAAFKVRVHGGVIADLRAGYGGMAATPQRVKALEDALIGKACAAHSFGEAADRVSEVFAPLSDFRATAEYRLTAAAGFLHRLGAQLVQPEQPADIWAL